MNERIFIVGAGAIGKALAVFLQHAGRSVVLVRARKYATPPEPLALHVRMNDGTIIREIIAVTDLDANDRYDGIVVMANKSIGNADIAPVLARRVGSSPVVLLQNGLAVEESLLSHHISNVYRCVLFATSQQITEDTIQFKPVSPSPIGVVAGDAVLVQKIVSLLDTPQFRFAGERNILPVVWKKVIANCVFNSICPLLDADNGVFHRDPVAMSLAEHVIAECVNVANAAGIVVNDQEVIETVLRISKASDGQLISTLQDIRHKRPTEIDSLNFAVVQIAATLDPKIDVSKTKMLGELTKLKSKISIA